MLSFSSPASVPTTVGHSSAAACVAATACGGGHPKPVPEVLQMPVAQQCNLTEEEDWACAVTGAAEAAAAAWRLHGLRRQAG